MKTKHSFCTGPLKRAFCTSSEHLNACLILRHKQLYKTIHLVVKVNNEPFIEDIITFIGTTVGLENRCEYTAVHLSPTSQHCWLEMLVESSSIHADRVRH